MDNKNEGVDSENEGEDKKFLPPERKKNRQRNPPTINYIDGRANQWSIGSMNLIFGSHALIHNIVKAFVNVVNATSTFFGPTPPTNIVKNETILTQYIIKQGPKVFGKKARLKYENNCCSFMNAKLLIQRRLKT